jgi:hypothetical protein
VFSRGTIVRLVCLVAALTLAAPLAALACGSSGYTYAGVFGQRRAAGIGATLTAVTAPQVLGGHVGAWVGLGGVGQGPGGSNEWIQVGLSAFPGTGTSSLYYEVARPGATPEYHELEVGILPGMQRRVLVSELRSRPGFWRIWVDGKPATGPIGLPASHSAEWLPTATAESWGGGTVVCNDYQYSFDRVRTVHEAGAGWTKLAAGTRFQDLGYRLVYRAPGSFLAGRADDADAPAARQTFGLKG